MAINWSEVVATAAVTSIVSFGVQQSLDDSTDDSTDSGDEVTQQATTDGGTEAAMERLLEHERRTSAPPESIDAYVGEVLNLSAGGTGTVEITPRQGFTLRVALLEFDRLTDHSYNFVVGGTQITENNRAEFEATRRVANGQKVVAEVTNNSGSSSTIDFQMVAWAIPTEDEKRR